MHPSAKIGKDCKIGPNVSIGIGCELENGVRVANAVLLHRVKVPALPLIQLLSLCSSAGRRLPSGDVLLWLGSAALGLLHLPHHSGPLQAEQRDESLAIQGHGRHNAAIAAMCTSP